MNSLMDIISNPVVWKCLISYYVFSAAVGALPTPNQNGSQFYEFIFRFGHILAGNLTRAAVTLKIPGADPVKDNS